MLEKKIDRIMALILVELDVKQGLSMDLEIEWGSQVYTQNLTIEGYHLDVG